MAWLYTLMVTYTSVDMYELSVLTMQAMPDGNIQSEVLLFVLVLNNQGGRF